MTKVSIIIPLYNSESTIEATLQSVVLQTYKNIECIIIDDCSSDESSRKVVNFIESYEIFKFKRLKTNKGGSYARNEGLKLARGEYVMFLDSDDLLAENCIENRLQFTEPSLGFIVFPNYARFLEIEKKNEIIADKKVLRGSRKYHLKKFIIHDLPLPWNIMGVLWKKKKLDDLGGFDERYMRLQDVELMVRALFFRLQYKVVENEVDCYYRYYNQEEKTVGKRNKFFSTSQIFIEENLKLDQEYELYEFLKKCLKKFYIHVFILSLISSQFSKNESNKFIAKNEKWRLLNNQMVSLLRASLVLRYFFVLPGLKGLIWRSMKLYIRL